MWRFATAIRDNNALTLKEQLRDIDLLIIDDMQFLQGKSIQNEFCHLINMLLDSAKQVVVAADRPPAELESLEPRVRSRLNGGVALEMSAPDYTMRLAMLKLRLQHARVEDTTLSIEEDILAHVARTVTGSGRELEGAFNQLLFRQSFEPQITIDRIDEILGHIYRVGRAQAGADRRHPADRRAALQCFEDRIAVEPPHADDRQAAASGDVSVEGDDAAFAAGNRPQVRRPRSHHGAPRRAQDRGLSGSDNTLAQELELLAQADQRPGLTAWSRRGVRLTPGRYPQEARGMAHQGRPRACLSRRFAVTLLRFSALSGPSGHCRLPRIALLAPNEICSSCVLSSNAPIS